MKVFILTTVLAPYRIDYFNELGKLCDLTVCFETKTDDTRDKRWFKSDFTDFKAIFLRNWDKPQWRIRTDLFKYMGSTDYDIAIAFEYSTPTAILFMLLNSLMRKPYCINGDGGFISDNLVKSVIKRFFIKKAEACLSSGKMAAQYFMHYGAIKERIFYHNFTSISKGDIIDQPITAEEKAIYKSDLDIPHKKTAIAVGQFIYRKGFDILIKAWNEVSPEYHLLIVGGGEKEQEYIKLIEEFNLGNVEIIGFKKKDELVKYYRASDLFILPTREDVWGLVINEAMASGLPIITTDRCVAGLELITDYENGFIVPVEQVDSFVNRIEEVMSNEKLAISMAEANLKKISLYTIESMAKQHFDILNDIK